ncbi:MAG: hypothetical protein E7580_07780 [Ruminococcaceae bacterium]|nr:hypothetical protein [Oscillospiraceae bacterium]
MKLITILGTLTGVLISLGTLVTVTVPALRNKLKKGLLRGEETERELRAIRLLLEEHVAKDEELREELALQKEVDLCVLRDLITGIYFRRAKEKRIHTYELEDASALHDLYRRRGGNSYVHTLYGQMTGEWEIIQ